MANRLLSIFSIFALAGCCMAGVATYAYNPYTGTYHLPTVYSASAPILARSYYAPAPLINSIASTYAAAPIVKSYSPFVRTYSAAIPQYVKTYATPVVQAAAPVVEAKAAIVAPQPAVVKTHAIAPVVETKAAVVAPAPAIVKTVEFEGNPRYDFSYGVHDSLTGDIKSQVETRDGGNVVGSYSVIDADGFKRTVTYTADDLNGFNAVVQREPLAKVATVAAVASTPVVPAFAPVQQQVQYLPQQPQQGFTTIQQQQQQEYLPQAEQQPQAPIASQPEIEPQPIEYPEQNQKPEQQYPQDEQFPPIGQQAASNDDSDVVEVRSAADLLKSSPSSTSAPAPVIENQKESESKN